jgi:hypothetical protein
MKSALLVLALAVSSSVGCRAMNSSCGQPCCDSGGGCCQPCHMAVAQNAPRPGGCCEGCACGSCSRGGNVEGNCPGGDCCFFDRYRGQSCNCGQGSGAGYPCGEYDCSPCDSPDWGCNGYRHPNGYVDGRPCLCQNGQCGGQPCAHCSHCGRNYCCSGPAPGCSCCPFCGCGPSGDQNYNFNPGPPVAQTAYPYYTLRGPRDFLLNNPPSIGPY